MKIIQSKKLCVAALAFLAMTACKSAAVGENTKVSTGNTVLTAKETFADSDPKTVLINSMKNLQQTKSWIVDVDTSNDAVSQGNSKMRIKYSAPENFHIENETAGNKMQMIAVGGKTYVEMGGKWKESPTSSYIPEIINNFKEMFDDQKLRAFKNIEFAGKETINGRELSAYTYEIDQEQAMPDDMKKQMTDEARAKIAEMQTENKAKIWIEAGRNLPARMEMTMKMTKPQQVTQKMTVDYTYDQQVKIEAPTLK